jgi:hypothetical protein
VTAPTVELLGLVGFGLSLTAVWLQWNMSHTISQLEDKLKDGRITSKVMERRIRRAQLMPMICTLTGAGLLIWAVIKLLH